MSDLNVAIIQSELHWHDPQANRDAFDQRLTKVDSSVDLVVLPEMFTTGFTMEPQACAEVMDGPTFDWMASHARKLDACLCGSLVISDSNHYFNRLIWMRPDGSYGCYDKRHLFRMANEHHHYSAGESIEVFQHKGWNVCPLVCYDLRFPVWSRNRQNYDLCIFVANWPAPRVNAWDTLLRARAIENSTYVIGVNRIGRDNNGKDYVGHSAIIDFFGKPMVDAKSDPIVAGATLELDKLNQFREKFPVHLDADEFHIA
ncbi:MAG: amidohydrolase [Pseudomonadota bacterium]